MADSLHPPPVTSGINDPSLADSLSRVANQNTAVMTPTAPPPPPPGGYFPAMPQAPATMPQAQPYKIPEDALSFLKQYDTVIVMDDSLSMWEDNRWGEAREALSAFIDLATKYDSDGVDICFLNSPTRKNVKHVSEIHALFETHQPRDGGTYIGHRLDEITREYLKKLKASKKKEKEKKGGFRSLFRSKSDEKVKAHAKADHVKPINFIIITDGQPTDEPGDIIKRVAAKLDKKDYPASQLGIQFLQIGNDAGAKAYLTELDDDLQKSGIRDIVDTTPYDGSRLTADMIAKMLLGGVNRRVDKKGGASVM